MPKINRSRALTRLLYLDCASGIAGDMLLAALIDAGLKAQNLQACLKSALHLGHWSFQIKRVQKGHFPARSLTIRGSGEYLGGVHEFTRRIKRGSLPPTAKMKSLKIFQVMCQAERKVHGRLPSAHHHAEEGLFSLDTLIDIVGNTWGIERMGITQVKASSPNLGKAAPATLEIARSSRLPIWTSGEPMELTTPTGLALLSVLAGEFGPCPPMRVERSGLGAGHKDRKNAPNVLSCIIGRPLAKTPGDRSPDVWRPLAPPRNPQKTH